MKKLLTLIALAAIHSGAFAAEPAEPAAPSSKAGVAAKAKIDKAAAAVHKATEPVATPAKPAVPAAKAMGMYTKVDAIDAAAKTFSHNNKDGTVVKFVVTDTTDIKNGDAAAKLSDIKVGDTVSGSRIKKSATEYEVVKITKFGPAPAKAEVEKKVSGDKKAPAPTEKKPN
ncbi:MAG: hypothetical protein K8R23_12815 [Chthoniobacter sp.]|nr:hypothetical protein [Chthoniobacter sp.]